MKYSYALGVLAMVFAAACSSASASSSPSATSTPASGATGVTVDLTDANQLQPTTITASAGTTVVSLLVAGAAIAMNVLWLIPIAAAAMLWGHYWDVENVMTIPSMVAGPRYGGVASGFSYIHTKLPQFLGIFLFPAFFRWHWRRQRDIFLPPCSPWWDCSRRSSSCRKSTATSKYGGRRPNQHRRRPRAARPSPD